MEIKQSDAIDNIIELASTLEHDDFKNLYATIAGRNFNDEEDSVSDIYDYLSECDSTHLENLHNQLLNKTVTVI